MYTVIFSMSVTTAWVYMVSTKHARGKYIHTCIEGFHGAWFHFQRARVRVCTRCSCVQDTGKEGLHWVLNISAEKSKKLILWKWRGPLYICLLIVHLSFKSRTLRAFGNHLYAQTYASWCTCHAIWSEVKPTVLLYSARVHKNGRLEEECVTP